LRHRRSENQLVCVACNFTTQNKIVPYLLTISCGDDDVVVAISGSRCASAR
jgi:hypothetical protein